MWEALNDMADRVRANNAVLHEDEGLMKDLNFLLQDCASDEDCAEKIKIINKIFEIVGLRLCRKLFEDTDANKNTVLHLAAVNGFARIFKVLKGKLIQLNDPDFARNMMAL